MTSALLFDMDGLLLNTERVARDSFVEIARDYGIAEAETFFLTLVGSSSAQTSAQIAAVLPAGADIDRFKKRWGMSFEARVADVVPLKPGVRDVIEALGNKSRQMVVVTSTRTAAARDQLGRAGLLPHFRDVVGGDMVRANKPDPAPYLLGAERAGVPPADCAAFEDSDIGVEAAVAAGCHVWQVPDLRPADTGFPTLGQQMAVDLESAVRASGHL